MKDNGVFSCIYGCCMYTEQERIIDANRLIKAQDVTELCCLIYDEVDRICNTYKDLPKTKTNCCLLERDLMDLKRWILLQFDVHGSGISPAFPCETYLEARVEDTIQAAIYLRNIEHSLLPISVYRLVHGYLHNGADNNE